MKKIKIAIALTIVCLVLAQKVSSQSFVSNDNYRTEKRGNFIDLLQKKSHQSYLGISSSIGTGVLNAPELPQLYRQDIGIYLKSGGMFYFQPEWRFGLMEFNDALITRELPFFQFPVSAVLDFRLLNVKAGANLEAYQTKTGMVAGHGFQVGFGTRFHKLDLDFRGAINGINSKYCNNSFTVQVGYLLNN
jgi:hypothetical protein